MMPSLRAPGVATPACDMAARHSQCITAFRTCRPRTRQRHVCRRATTCSTQAAELLSEGRAKHDRGDRMGAVMMYEKALKKDPTIQQRQEALYHSTCAHAFAGDLEFAQVTLRDAIVAGLDFEAALQDSSMVKLQASQQVMIQLRKFAQKVQRGQQQGGDKEAGAASAPRSSKSPTAQRISLTSDASQLLGTDMTGLDTSVGGVIKRVAALLLVLSVLGIVLFFVGFKYAFPEAR